MQKINDVINYRRDNMPADDDVIIHLAIAYANEAMIMP